MFANRISSITSNFSLFFFVLGLRETLQDLTFQHIASTPGPGARESRGLSRAVDAHQRDRAGSIWLQAWEVRNPGRNPRQPPDPMS